MDKKYNKAITLSYDDGVASDIRLIEILNKYNIKATFNLNSEIQSSDSQWVNQNAKIRRMDVEETLDLYKGHEVGFHGSKHLHPIGLTDAELEIEFSRDITALEKRYNTKIIGGAYSFGEYDENLVKYLKGLNMKYSRTVKSNHSFDLQSKMLEFEPTCHHNDEKLMDLAERFLSSNSDKPQIFYLWGHSYEFDVNQNWELIEEFCKFVSGRDDVLYGTNEDVFKYFNVI